MGFADQIITGAATHMRFLAPLEATGTEGAFRRARRSNDEYFALLSQVQRLRGSVYLRDGAITPADLDPQGRYRTPSDLTSWHVLQLGPAGDVTGCARYRAHPVSHSFHHLDARHAALATDPSWGGWMREAVCYQISECERKSRDFFEVSGWAIAESARFSDSAFAIALATYCLGTYLGGGRGIATATTRNRSSSILQRLGGRPLEYQGVALPPYYDKRFGCMMEIVAFDTEATSPKYLPFVEGFLKQLPALPVLYRDDTKVAMEPALVPAAARWTQAAA